MKEVVTTKVALRARLDAERAAGRTVGLVPTMGALHEGHLSLVDAAAAECDVVALTIFVNPLQFAAGEDLDAYPRPLSRDLELAEGAGTTVAFTPSTDEMYPRPTATSVHVEGLTATMEGASRPTHFDGVTTVVTKLFNVAGPCRAYFGEKDYQQLAIVSRMAEDLSFPVEVVGCPTTRHDDGLALSSRNAYLTAPEREAAPVLHRALGAGAAMVAAGESDADAVRAEMARIIEEAPLGELDYVEVADPRTLAAVTRCDRPVRLFGAVRFGRARLIDNVAAGAP